jgi:23S rRNA pseudouridine2605 synthase
MRLNLYIAQRTDLSRREADRAIANGRVRVNDLSPSPGQDISDTDAVTLDGKQLKDTRTPVRTIRLNKPVGYVCSRNGQGSRTIYELLPPELKDLNPIGRLDKDSSGLLLMTNDGQLAQQLSHPSYQKIKIYHIATDKPLQPFHQQMISDFGINLEDGLSHLSLTSLDDSRQKWEVSMHEGRNRQIRRTFGALGYDIVRLHRIKFGDYTLDDIKPGEYL